MGNYWTFKVFVSARGRNVIAEWLGSLPIDARYRIRLHFDFMMGLKDWSRPYAAKLKGKKYDPIWEIRFTWNKFQYRPLGCFGPDDGDFTILIGAIEKSKGVFKPRNAPETAKERCLLIREDRRYVNDYKK